MQSLLCDWLPHGVSDGVRDKWMCRGLVIEAVSGGLGGAW